MKGIFLFGAILLVCLLKKGFAISEDQRRINLESEQHDKVIEELSKAMDLTFDLKEPVKVQLNSDYCDENCGCAGSDLVSLIKWSICIMTHNSVESVETLERVNQIIRNASDALKVLDGSNAIKEALEEILVESEALKHLRQSRALEQEGQICAIKNKGTQQLLVIGSQIESRKRRPAFTREGNVNENREKWQILDGENIKWIKNVQAQEYLCVADVPFPRKAEIKERRSVFTLVGGFKDDNCEWLMEAQSDGSYKLRNKKFGELLFNFNQIYNELRRSVYTSKTHYGILPERLLWNIDC